LKDSNFTVDTPTMRKLHPTRHKTTSSVKMSALYFFNVWLICYSYKSLTKSMLMLLDGDDGCSLSQTGKLEEKTNLFTSTIEQAVSQIT
jgi:hypothetical protein